MPDMDTAGRRLISGKRSPAILRYNLPIRSFFAVSLSASTAKITESEFRRTGSIQFSAADESLVNPERLFLRGL